MFWILLFIFGAQAEVFTWNNSEYFVRLAWDNTHHFVPQYGRVEHINLHWYKIRGVRPTGHFKCGKPIEDWVIFKDGDTWIARVRTGKQVKVIKTKNWEQLEKQIHIPQELRDKLRKVKNAHFAGGDDDDNDDNDDSFFGDMGNGKIIYFDRAIFPFFLFGLFIISIRKLLFA